VNRKKEHQVLCAPGRQIPAFSAPSLLVGRHSA